MFVRRYVVGIDPYDDDYATTDSVGCAFVFDRFTRRIVAEYTGRPQLAKDFYENCRKLIVYYNAAGFPEINKLGFVTYMEPSLQNRSYVGCLSTDWNLVLQNPFQNLELYYEPTSFYPQYNLLTNNSKPDFLLLN